MTKVIIEPGVTRLGTRTMYANRSTLDAFWTIVVGTQFRHYVVMPFSAEAVANEFLQLAYRDHKTISPLKMQKLVYFAHGWYLAITGRPLLSEPIQAWQYGPVIPTLYRQFKEWGADPIRFPATKEVPGKGTIRPKLDDEGSPEEVETARKVIERVWKQYGRLSAAKLTALTHSENTPWARLPDKEEPGTIIPDEDIRDYFVRLAKAG